MTANDSFPRAVSLQGEVGNQAAIPTQIQGRGGRGQQGLHAVGIFTVQDQAPVPFPRLFTFCSFDFIPSHHLTLVHCWHSSPFASRACRGKSSSAPAWEKKEKSEIEIRTISRFRIKPALCACVDPPKHRPSRQVLCILPRQWMTMPVSHPAKTNPRFLTGRFALQLNRPPGCPLGRKQQWQ
jgi:hypothetical protein